MCNVPVLNCIEGVLVSDVIHKQEAHGSSVVGCGNGAISLLSCCVLEEKIKIHALNSMLVCFIHFGFSRLHKTILCQNNT